MSTSRRSWVLAAGLGLAGGCHAAADSPALETDTASDDGGSDGDSGDAQLPVECEQGAQLGPTPLRRLTHTEYDNTVRDLLGDLSRPATSFVADEIVDGFAANAVAPVSAAEVDQYVEAAEQLAATAVAERLDQWLSCDPGETACVEPWLAELGARAFRRPLADDEQQELVALYEQGRSEWDAQVGVQLALTALLASPQFVYHVEVGAPELADGAAVPLTGHEIASRLSYFAWATMPDQALFDAAAAGELDTAEGIEAQIRRLLDDPRARDTLDSFHTQWLGLDELDGLDKDPDTFPQWSPQLAEAMRTETLRFVEHVIRQDDARISTLLTAPFSFVDEGLAGLYGVSPPATAFGRVELPAEQRAGLLTHASLLASQAHQSTSSWVQRGRFVRTHLLCHDMPAPPDDIDFSQANDPDRLENPECSGCHLLMDPIGEGFDGYDAIGGYIGGGISGHLSGVSPDVDGPFDGPVDLAHRLADSEPVHACIADRWFVYATRRTPTIDDECSMESAVNTLAATDQDIVELLVGITLTPAFRYRRAPGA